MKVAVTCQPAWGHFCPIVPLLKALRADGHDVLVATSASFVPEVERAGIAAVATGLDWLESSVDTAFPDLVPDASMLAPMRAAWPMVFGRAARRFLPEFIALLEGSRVDLVVCEGFEYSGALAAEVLGVPHIRFGIGPLLPGPVVVRSMGAYWDVARRHLGLSPDPDMQRAQPALYLTSYPESFQPLPISDLSAHAATLRPELGDIPNGETVETSGRRPLVYVTLGTVFNRIDGVLETIVDSLGDLPVDVVVATGERRDPLTLAQDRPNVQVRPMVRQNELLGRADLIVFHGGSATTVAAVAAGVPGLVVPIGADQGYNALRLSAAGAGLVLPLRELDGRRLHERVHELLNLPHYRANAARLRREVESARPMSQAVRLIESSVDAS